MEDRPQWKAVNWNAVFNGACTAPFLFMRSGLIRKDLLHQILAGDPCVPRTYTLHSAGELQALLSTAQLQQHSHVWVLKPARSSNANGIRFIDVRAITDELLADLAKDWSDGAPKLLQEYIIPPLLPGPAPAEHGPPGERLRGDAVATGDGAAAVGGHKWHLRVLVLAVGRLKVYVRRGMAVLVAPEPLPQPPSSDLASAHAHVTNRAHNAAHPRYRAALHCLALGGSRCGAALLPVASIRAQAARICGYAFAALMRAPAPGQRRQFLPLANCYELYGFDFMLDGASGLLKLLEANPDPSLAMFGVTYADVLPASPLQQVPEDFDLVYDFDADGDRGSAAMFA